MKSIKFLILFVVLVSCSSIQEKQDKVLIEKQSYHKIVKNLEIIANIKTNFDGANLSFSSKLLISGNDSLQMSVFAGLGFQVGKLYSNVNDFIFYNIFENSVYKGKPTSENLLKVTKINLSFDEFVRLIKSETPADITAYTTINNVENKEIIALSRKKQGGTEYITLNKENSSLRQYQFKDEQNNLITSITYKDYKNFSNEPFATNIVLNFKELNGTVTFEIEDIKINPTFTSPFRFKYPSDAKIIEF